MLNFAFLVLLFFKLNFANSIDKHPYPIEGSWFADRYTKKEWSQALDDFSRVNGSIIWQRGRIFRTISSDDLQQDFNFQWCYHGLKTGNAIHCVPKAKQDVQEMGATLVNFLLYDYEENYPEEAMLKCPYDYKIKGSRVYHILYVPHDAQQENPCDVRGKKVDVIMTYFSGIDSKELMFKTIQEKKLNHFKVYLGSPYIPVMASSPFLVDGSILPAFYEFTKRVYESYQKKYLKYPVFSGVYQAMETGMGFGEMDKNLISAYEVLYKMTHEMLDKKVVLSPYGNAFKDQVSSTSIDLHVQNFGILAQLCDIIAPQEGRGCGKQAYYSPHQIDQRIIDIDPRLDKVVHYIEVEVTSFPTFKEKYHFSLDELFAGFYNKLEEFKKQGIRTPELWLNVEGFEYSRYAPCTPVDLMGNGMAELLDRTAKDRLDYALSVQSKYVSRVISFAWDYCYYCVPEESEYTKPLFQEIYDDFDRPIINDVRVINETIVGVFGFNVASLKLELSFKCDGKEIKMKPYQVDENWGKNNNKSYLMGMATMKNLFSEYKICEVNAKKDGKKTYHPYFLYL